LQVLGEESERLNRILTEFLRFARVEARRDALEPAECVVADVLEGTLALVRQDLDSAGVSIDCDLDTLRLKVSVEGDNLRQVLLNLVLNASDAMPNGGTIWLNRAARNGETVTLEVVDSGHGVPPEVASSIFDPFFSTKDGGVGLGLSIVARLLEASGGSITLDRTPRPGARFLVKLPLAVH
jgi:signal transduction histidine kinase